MTIDHIFGAAARDWFGSAFDSPTDVQLGAWDAIASGEHALVVAPTGSGKTLAAFLHSLDWLARQPATGKVQVLYVSPLKALVADIEANLRAPLRGISLAAERLGEPTRDITVGMRTGDTSAAERRRLVTDPPDILITTPESLFLLLSSQAAQTLDSLRLIIVDEVHALAGTKRGAHLAVCLERLASAAKSDPQRIGLSATVRPAERVARFLGGDRRVRIVAPPAQKRWDLQVKVPVPDLSNLPADAPSVWPFVEAEILDAITAHRSTICFVNSRRVAERLTARLNELQAERLGLLADPTSQPAEIMANSGATRPIADGFTPIAEAHHGSVAHVHRKRIEQALKSGQLPCVVATSSLELGIDMGAVDLVLQVNAPPTVASGLQRLGRAGHQVGAVSRGQLLPTNRGGLLEAAVVAERMIAGEIEAVPELRLPLDVLAQHVLSACIDAPVRVPELHSMLRRTAPFGELSRAVMDSVLDMLAGRYPSEEFAELRPRLIWDRVADEIVARPGARRLVTTSGGTIPDRGLYGVFLVGEGNAAGKHSPGRRVGELDEEMVHESRVGDVIALGASSWTIAEITPHQVLVTPAGGVAGRLPFWRGDAMSRPAELGYALARLQREASADTGRLRMLDDNAKANATRYLSEQREATGVIPDDQTIVVERFRDEIGDWRICVHSPFGLAVNSPWAMAIEARLRASHGFDGSARATNDGIVLRLPDTEDRPPGADLIAFDPASLPDIVTDEVGNSALFAARFRECAARALLLPRRDPGRRTPLWQQRQRSAQLLAVAAHYPDFPIMLEAMRECLNDVFDLPALCKIQADVAARRMRLVEVETSTPSPFAKGLLFGYLAEFLYDEDQPLAERRVAALSLDTALLAELLGRDQLLDELDQAVLDAVQSDLLGLPPETIEQAYDTIRLRGPIAAAEIPAHLLEPLLADRRVATIRVAGQARLVTADDLGLVRDALGVPVPAGFPEPGPEHPDVALRRLVQRRLRCVVLDTAPGIAAWLGVPVDPVAASLAALVEDGIAVRGRFSGAVVGEQYMHQSVLGRVKRKALSSLRNEVQPVSPPEFARFLLGWHELDRPSTGVDGVLSAAEQLAGYPIPASMLESMVLRTRVADYAPSMLEELLTSGELIWVGESSIGTQDGYVALWPSDIFPGVTAELPDGLAGEVFEVLSTGGAWRFDDLLDRVAGNPRPELRDALWQLTWAGLITCDTLAPVRALSTSGALKRRAPTPRAGRRMLRPSRVVDPQSVGRWSALPRATPSAEAEARLQGLLVQLNRYGVLTRGSVLSEPNEPSFGSAYRDLSLLEERGTVRRGYFVEGLGASQFALPGAVDALRRSEPWPEPVALAATDPANPYGAALPWPATLGHRPSRRAGALVVLSRGEPVWFCERGMGTLVGFPDTPTEVAEAGLRALAEALRGAGSKDVKIVTINGKPSIAAYQLHESLIKAGFGLTPSGYRLRGV